MWFSIQWPRPHSLGCDGPHFQEPSEAGRQGAVASPLCGRGDLVSDTSDTPSKVAPGGVGSGSPNVKLVTNVLTSLTSPESVFCLVRSRESSEHGWGPRFLLEMRHRQAAVFAQGQTGAVGCTTGQWGLDIRSPHLRLGCLVAKQLPVSKVTKAKIK